MGSTELGFFEDDSVAERLSRRLLGHGAIRETDSIFSTLRAPRGPRGEGEGETRDRRVPGRFPVGRGGWRRDLPCESVAKTARRSTKAQLYFVIQCSRSGSGMFPAG